MSITHSCIRMPVWASRRTHALTLLIAAAACGLFVEVAVAQSSPSSAQASQPLTLSHAKTLARATSAEIRGAREAIRAAQARELQANAFLNPALTYGREQTARGGQRNSQDIAQVEQALEIGGQRGARKNAARIRREAAEAQLVAIEQQLDFEVTRAFHLFLAASRRAALADSAANIFREAERVSAERFAAGDVSGYTTRRLRLETARYASQRAEASLALRTARIELASLLGITTIDVLLPVHATNVAASQPVQPIDSLRALAARSRAELRVRMLEASAITADAHLARSDRVPTPTFSAGYKRESVDDGINTNAGTLNGFVAGFSLPLPVFDRKSAAVQALSADASRATAESDALRRRIDREVQTAFESLNAVESQLLILQPRLGEEASLAMRAVQVSYSEGEITLVEWLDAVRAYQEAEATLATLQTEAAVRRAALERAVGTSLFAR